MASSPHLTGPLVVTAKFGYRRIILLTLLSLSFWLLTIIVVPIGAAVIAIFRTIRRVPEENRSNRAFLREFFRSIRGNLVTGLPLTVLIAGVPLATILYMQIAFTEGSAIHFLVGLPGIYASLLAVLVAFRVANVLSLEPGIGIRGAFDRAYEASVAYPLFSVLHACLVVPLVVFSVVFPVFFVFLFPGVLAVLEILLYEETTRTTESPIRAYLQTLP